MKTTFVNSLSYKNPSMPLFKWPKKPFIAVNLPELPAGDQRWQENESSDSMSTLICFLVVHPIMKNILINWRKVIHFAFLVDEATFSGSSTSQLRNGNNVFTFWQDASHSHSNCISGMSCCIVYRVYLGVKTQEINTYIKVRMMWRTFTCRNYSLRFQPFTQLSYKGSDLHNSSPERKLWKIKRKNKVMIHESVKYSPLTTLWSQYISPDASLIFQTKKIFPDDMDSFPSHKNLDHL